MHEIVTNEVIYLPRGTTNVQDSQECGYAK